MSGNQINELHKIVRLQKELSDIMIDYWMKYSNLGTWQFWIALSLIIIPLIILYFAIDRKLVFRVGFFGFAVHMLFSYTDAYGIRRGLWAYPYDVFPQIPSFSYDAAIIPIAIMLLYQWTYKHKKNFYVYSFLLALVFGLLFKPTLSKLNLFSLQHPSLNFFYIFLIYYVLYLVAYWITFIFDWMHRQEKSRKRTST